MKNLLMITATSLLLASSASAGGIVFSVPDLWFPPTDDTTVAKECLTPATTPEQCVVEE